MLFCRLLFDSLIFFGVMVFLVAINTIEILCESLEIDNIAISVDYGVDFLFATTRFAKQISYRLDFASQTNYIVLLIE